MASLLALNGLRIGGPRRRRRIWGSGHRTLVVHRKGGKLITIALATPHRPSSRPGERLEGPIFLDAHGQWA